MVMVMVEVEVLELVMKRVERMVGELKLFMAKIEGDVRGVGCAEGQGKGWKV